MPPACAHLHCCCSWHSDSGTRHLAQWRRNSSQRCCFWMNWGLVFSRDRLSNGPVVCGAVAQGRVQHGWCAQGQLEGVDGGWRAQITCMEAQASAQKGLDQGH